MCNFVCRLHFKFLSKNPKYLISVLYNAHSVDLLKLALSSTSYRFICEYNRVLYNIIHIRPKSCTLVFTILCLCRTYFNNFNNFLFNHSQYSYLLILDSIIHTQRQQAPDMPLTNFSVYIIALLIMMFLTKENVCMRLMCILVIKMFAHYLQNTYALLHVMYKLMKQITCVLIELRTYEILNKIGASANYLLYLYIYVCISCDYLLLQY